MTVEYNPAADIVESRLQGPLSGGDLMNAAMKRAALARENGTSRFLIDARGLRGVQETTETIFDIVTQTYPKEHVKIESTFAVVTDNDPDSAWFAEFYQRICVSRGWVARHFDDRDTALDWLTQPKVSANDDEHWRVEYNESKDFVELLYFGAIDGNIIADASSARIGLGIEKGTNAYLIDASEVTEAHNTVGIIFDQVTRTYAENHLDPADMRVAAIEPRAKEARWFIKFYEDVSQSRGWQVRRFADRDSAFEWLLDSGA